MMENQPVRALGWSGVGRPLSETLLTERSPAGPAVGAAEILTAVRRNLARLVIWVALCVGIAALYLAFAPIEYVATTQVVLEAHRQAGSPTEAAWSGMPPTLDSAQADSEIEVVRSERTLRYVFDALDIAHDPTFAKVSPGLVQRLMGLLPVKSDSGTDPAEAAARADASAFETFRDRVDVRRIGNSYVLEVAFRAPTPSAAMRLANAVTASYIRAQINQRSASVEGGAQFLQERIAGLKSEQQAVENAIRLGRMPDVTFSNADARVVSAATEPLYKSFPRSKLTLLFAVVLGLFTGLCAVVLRQSFDQTIWSRAQFRRVLGFDCLATLPSPSGRVGALEPGVAVHTAAVDCPHSAFARAMRVLRSAVLSALSGARLPAIGVVSCGEREGRSVIAANLAQLVAASGQAVTLIDGDLRARELSRSLISAPAESAEAFGAALHESHLMELPLGPDLAFVPAAPAAHGVDANLIVSGSEMQRALREIRAKRVVIFDLPALSSSADALSLGSLLDGVVLSVELGRTTFDEASEAMVTLSSANVRVLGVVLSEQLTGSTSLTRLWRRA